MRIALQRWRCSYRAGLFFPRTSSTTGCWFWRSVWYVRARGSSVSRGPLFGRKLMREKLWREFFWDPSQWWDHRSEKANPKYPDFTHKKTQQSLWIIDNLTPPWVVSELAVMAPGLLQSDSFSWNVRLRRHVKAGDHKMTLRLYQQMQREGMIPDRFTFVPVLKACSTLRYAEEGRLVHEQIIQRGCETDAYVANCLVDMYIKCGSIKDAWSVFQKIRQHDVFCWSAMIGAYVKSGYGLKAIDLFWKMQQDGVVPNAVTFVGVLNACANVASLEEGRRVHEQIIQRGCESDLYVTTCLVDMYAKCGSIEDAWSVFSKMQKHDVVSWNAMIGGFVKSEQGLRAMELFEEMQNEGVEPDAVTFIGVLNACASLAALEEGRSIHEQIIQSGCESEVYVANCLIDMYAKCGRMEDAWSVFKRMGQHNVVSWSTMIGGYVKSEQGRKALEFFWKMQDEGVEPNAITFVGVLNACASVAALDEGQCVHEQIIQKGCDSDLYVSNCLVDMYAKCGSIENAWSVFNQIRERNVVSWNAMIGGYVKSGQASKAMEVFRSMKQEQVEPNAVTFVGMLNACASIPSLEEGRRVHEQIIQRGCESDVYVATCLVDMYAKCGSIEDARNVFNKMAGHDLVSWNAMIGGYVKSGQGLKAMELFESMQQEGVEPNAVTFVGVLNACASVAALVKGRFVHEQIIQRGCETDVYVANCLVEMYAKCGSFEEACSIFDKMQQHDVFSWNAMIGSYVKSGQGLKAMELFRKMQQEGVEPNAVTFVGALTACASVLDLQEGRRVHDDIIQRGYESDLYVATCLVDMYAKCGSIEDAYCVFTKMGEHDLVSWNAMIGGYVESGQGLKALELFKKMQHEGVEPNAVTFIGVLNACASVPALKEGRFVHGQIIQRGCESDDHVANCLVNMYAKCGSIEDAWNVFKKMQIQTVVSYTAMIGGYAMHGHPEKAIGLFKRMCKEGVELSGITFICLLSACSHGGLVKEGLRFFKSMTSCYDMRPTVEHYVCMVDVLGRVGQLKEAEKMTKTIPVESKGSMWMSLLGACRIHGNIEMAEQTARKVWELDPGNASGHVLLWNIYAAAQKWDSIATIERRGLERRV